MFINPSLLLGKDFFYSVDLNFVFCIRYMVIKGTTKVIIIKLISKLLNRKFYISWKKEDIRKNNYYVNNTYNLLNSYHKMQYYYLPVFDNRSGHNRITDKGVIDVFNIHKILPSINDNINIELILN